MNFFFLSLETLLVRKMAKLGSFTRVCVNMQATYPIVQYMDGDIWAHRPTWMLTPAAPDSLKQQLYA